MPRIVSALLGGLLLLGVLTAEPPASARVVHVAAVLPLPAVVDVVPPPAVPVPVVPAPKPPKPPKKTTPKAVPPPTATGPSAATLLAKLGTCDQISTGEYATDDGESPTVPVCQAGGAVFYTADLDIDCDGKRTARCNEDTDCCFLPDTAFHTSADEPLDAAALPYVVLPSPSATWDYRDWGIDGGAVVAVIHGGRVEYAVVGDTGPDEIIGEASYATAADLGVDPDPSTGGTDGPVTYLVFPNSSVRPIEDHGAAVGTGEELARAFVEGGTG